MLKKILFFITIISVFSCNNQSETEEKIDRIDVDLKVIRFEQEFASTKPQQLPELKQKYPFLFPEQFPDSVWIDKLSDTLQLEINQAVEDEFSNFTNQKDELYALFQHMKYYFPEFEVPVVITVTSEVDYKNKIIYTGDYLFVSLDTYLGTDHQFYTGLQEYLKKNFKKDQIVVDAAEEISKKYVPGPDSRTFLSHMVYYGKIQYLKEMLLPMLDPARRIGYTEEEFNFAENNESQIWRYFVENELIYDTDNQLQTRFLFPAPFSKFYLQLDAESPARLGQYIGLKIVKAYMEKNDISLDRMLNTSAEEIFNKANFKPKK
ncbi:gliding motility lipoprotein GldB [uncultured Christiangramia sp.]|uniref:gliding motility lipoprotein GldB n=1 Tax=uncultured Christiangramia sp. TaxID=503836 RepID=UPI002622BE82|nr:gliding motility lipoprotein GldB [uncultured Christiangramia sp.]